MKGILGEVVGRAWLWLRYNCIWYTVYMPGSICGMLMADPYV